MNAFFDLVGYISFRVRNNEFSLDNSNPSCIRCTVQHGTFIRPDFSFGSRNTENLTLLENESTCPAGYQCVADNDLVSSGCCKECSAKQLCTKGTISFGGDLYPSWNLCPPGFLCNDDPETILDEISPCEAGKICLDNKQLSCKKARQIPIDAGLGDIHAGSYCPPRSFALEFCPEGMYCNSTDMSKAEPCPAGKFCPYKTETPWVECAGCDEGVTERMPNPLIINFLIAVAIVLVAGIIFFKTIFFFRRKTVKNSNEILQPAQVELDNTRMRKSVITSSAEADRPRRELSVTEMLQSVKELVESINNKELVTTSSKGSIKGNLNIDCSIFESNSALHILEDDDEDEEDDLIIPVLSSTKLWNGFTEDCFDVEAVFNKLDLNHDGVLSFDELNQILNLSEEKLRYFVRRINKLDGVALDSTTITKKCFINHFINVLFKLENFEADEGEAAEIFEAINLDGSGVIENVDLYSRVMENIFSDRQIRIIEKQMAPNGGKITKKTFMEMYPLLLSEIDDAFIPDRGVDISFSDLKLAVHVSGKEVIVVNSVSGRIQEGTMTAIMGGSGTGKTSLLNTLCGKAHYGHVTGTVKINGNIERIEDHRHILGFVPQDDIVHAELTVRENFIYAGRFQLPPDTTAKEIEDLADDVIADLGLARVKDSLVGDVNRRGVSGGEKKRVNIGLELMAKPRILFLDEPTNGLDATSSSLVMSSLKGLVSNAGMTCISVIDQPRKFIFELFDNVMLLGVGGRLVYHGNPLNAQTYFENLKYEIAPGENISDWLLDISTGQLGAPLNVIQETSDSMENFSEARKYLFERWQDFVQRTPEYEMTYSLVAPAPFEIPADPGKPSFFQQVFFHVKRNLLLASRNLRVKVIDCTLIVIAAVVVSIINGKFIFTQPVVIDTVKDALEGTVGVPLTMIESAEALLKSETLTTIFRPFSTASLTYRANGMKINILVSVLVGLTSIKAISEKRLEFYRESSSGYNINAYFVAVNITSMIEVIIQMVLAGFFSAVIMMPISSWFNFILNFVILGWVCASWALLFAVTISPKNLVLVTGFGLSFFNIFLSGGMPPVFFLNIYESPRLRFLSGFLAPGRYFLETFVVSDLKCFPIQTGFTVSDIATSIPEEVLSFNVNGIGMADKNIAVRSCQGWYGAYFPPIAVGLFYRLLAGGLIHIIDRNKQGKKSFFSSLKVKSFAFGATLYLLSILMMFSVSTFLILR